MLRAAPLNPLPGLDAWSAQEQERFAAFMVQRDHGRPIPRRDHPATAALRLVTRMEAAAHVTAATELGDAVARARARLTGQIVQGTVRHPRCIQVAPHRLRSFFDLESTQAVVRPRVDDVLVDVSQPRRRVRVTDRVVQAGRTVLTLEIVQGQRAVGLPAPGDIVELAEHVPDWPKVGRRRV